MCCCPRGVFAANQDWDDFLLEFEDKSKLQHSVHCSPAPGNTFPPLPPSARQLVDPWGGVAHCGALVGQQQPGRPVSFLFPSLLADTAQAASWSTGLCEWPDGSLERLVGGGGRLDIWQLLEVQNQIIGALRDLIYFDL